MSFFLHQQQLLKATESQVSFTHLNLDCGERHTQLSRSTLKVLPRLRAHPRAPIGRNEARSVQSQSGNPTLGPDVMRQSAQSRTGPADEWVWAVAGGAEGEPRSLWGLWVLKFQLFCTHAQTRTNARTHARTHAVSHAT